MWKRVFRARTLVYIGLLAAIVTAAGISLYVRETLKVDVIRDRGTLARETAAGGDRERLSSADHEHRRDAAGNSP